MNDTELTYDHYKHSLRDKALGSHQDLQEAFSTYPSIQQKLTRRNQYDSLYTENRQTEFSDRTYSRAVHDLQKLINNPKGRDDRNVLFNERTSYKDYHYEGFLPKPEEVVPILKKQSILLKHVENENEYLKEQLQEFRTKLLTVVEENNVLHEELKSGLINLMLQQDTFETAHLQENQLLGAAITNERNEYSKADLSTWQREIVRTELEEKSKELEDVKSELRLKNALNVSPDQILTGLCVSCGRNEAVLSTSSTTPNKAVENITKERDELAQKMLEAQKQLNVSRSREQEAYEQVKQSVAFVEESQLERTQALYEKEQLRERLAEMHLRMEKHTEETAAKMVEERSIIRKEVADELNDLNEKLNTASSSFIKAKSELETVCRDKVDLLAEVERLKEELSKYDFNYGHATDSMKMTATHSTIERNAAINEMRKMRVHLEKTINDSTKEKERLQMENDNLQRRLATAEKQLIDSKENCIELMNRLQELERDAHGAKLAKETIEKNRSDDLKSLSLQAQKREQELNVLLDTLETKSAKRTIEFEDIANAQRHLVDQLRSECHNLTEKLSFCNSKYRKENSKLKSQNQILRERLNKAQERLDDFEQQNHAHGVLHEKLRERIRQLDEHGGNTASQIVELLTQQQNLLRDRSLLVREVEFLRNQLLSTQKEEILDVVRSYSTHYTTVDEIIARVNADDMMHLKTAQDNEKPLDNDDNTVCNEQSSI
ncbi:DgyrCDS11891 [Dimorphilus gyrociliatus]|uniref:DgyrCDS11891 n=1 Tax=Dimorphilus gyrociliatus TaxID=2664684 RepID=A0A7I8W6N9_9ANNE|nr:DgyrCDS11891 [Dimorphilus gyrociliatus]